MSYLLVLWLKCLNAKRVTYLETRSSFPGCTGSAFLEVRGEKSAELGRRPFFSQAEERVEVLFFKPQQVLITGKGEGRGKLVFGLDDSTLEFEC